MSFAAAASRLTLAATLSSLVACASAAPEWEGPTPADTYASALSALEEGDHSRGRAELAAVLERLRVLIHPGLGARDLREAVLRRMQEVRLLGSAGPAPLVEAVAGHDAAPLPERRAERGRSGHRLRSRVDARPRALAR